VTATPSAFVPRDQWQLFMLRGIVAVAFGVLVLALPGATVVALMAFIAAYAIGDGVVALVYGIRLRHLFVRWWALLFHGLIAIAFGLLAFLRPGLSLLYVLMAVALWMLFAAVTQFLLARAQWTMGAPWRWSVVGGLLTLLLAVLAISHPGLTIAAVVVLIAWFALLLGMVQLVVAFRLRRAVRAATGRS
jgi:uncharacterized membrane protein HdeD (DUF308 family)